MLSLYFLYRTSRSDHPTSWFKSLRYSRTFQRGNRVVTSVWFDPIWKLGFNVRFCGFSFRDSNVRIPILCFLLGQSLSTQLVLFSLRDSNAWGLWRPIDRVPKSQNFCPLDSKGEGSFFSDACWFQTEELSLYFFVSNAKSERAIGVAHLDWLGYCLDFTQVAWCLIPPSEASKAWW